jgi:SlyX protein
MSDDLAEHTARLDQLEIRIAHQDRVIAELNEVITSQWRRIDALGREVLRLREEFQTSDTGRDAPEPPPPHY